ncbi:DNA primase [Candidatus Nitrosoglobus terrae]|uniref:DNA primase n=1 Tax=Candidatus Nitrosoglobus terrae TaxID=1630141 RepID=A0A1Q2SJU3_9GAMM|nr:DNA primase [Candidatus Nitrosoglobus terrae]BAW79399.1 DNA primase [Candidatus Nitrosoglobus terrae]
MGEKIPQAFIDDLIARTDIVELINSRISLRKAGRQYVACCPFHSEKTPSFTVSLQKQFYYCFGCGVHGTAISFLMAFDHLNFVEAIEELAQQAGMVVPRESNQLPDTSHRKLYEVLSFAADFYHQQLKVNVNQNQGRIKAYLRERGLSRSIVAEFKLGFAPSRWDILLSNTQLSLRPYLKEAGLVIDRDSGHCYDRFRGRLIFPIHDYRGQVIGFGGRLLGGEGSPKYLNSPETSLFHKRRELYGLYQVRKSIRNYEKILVVEGYMDVLSLAQHKIRYVVATLGTATTSEQLTRLFQMTSQVIFCFDGDRAGQEAAWRALETALPLLKQGRQVQFMFLPTGEDPDTLIRAEGQVAFESRLEKAVPLSEVLLNGLQRKVKLDNIDGRVHLIELARPFIAKIPSGVYQDMLFSRLAEIAQIGQVSLARYLRKSEIPRQQLNCAIDMDSPVQKMIAILLQHPNLIHIIEDSFSLQGLKGVELQLLQSLITLLRSNPYLNTASLLEHWKESKMGQQLRQLAIRELFLTDNDMILELKAAIACLQAQAADDRMEVLSNRPVLTAEEQQELLILLAAKQSNKHIL